MVEQLWHWICHNPHVALALYYTGLGVVTLAMIAVDVNYWHRWFRGLWGDP